jgi:hypothetical protein
MVAWLKCSLESGMFPSEYAVAIETEESGTVSLFADNDKVDAAQCLVRGERKERSCALAVAAI